MSAPRARRLVAAGVVATVLTAGSVGAAVAAPVDGPVESGVEAPAAPDAPAEETPVTDSPVAEVPSEEAPTDQAPADEAPVVDAPVDEPVVDAPVDEPVVDAPTEEPVVEAPVDEVPVEEAPADVEVVAPTAVDATVELTAGETVEVDLDDHVLPGTGAIESIDAWGWPLELEADYDETTHVLTMSPWQGGTHTVEFQASALTPGANGQDERSGIGTLTVVVADAVDPVISWLETPAASTTSTTARFSVAVDPGEFVLGYVVDLHPEAQSASPVMVEGSTFEVTGLSVGRHTIRVVVERGAGWSALDYAWDVVATGAPAAPAAPPAAAPAAPVLSPDAIPASVVRAGLRRGAVGESVAIIQRVVGVEADGRFGAATRAAVIAFQRAHGLVPDGIVGPLTWAAIVDVANGGTGSAPAAATSIPAAQIARGISRGAVGSSVSVIQRIVGANPDGRFGPRTQAAVRAWQKAHGLVADGIVGRLTWAAMVAR
ncbi:hydrolase [Cellulomonas cellasea DSM 20118]|uniref:Hydrolase n=1 Tax=Cellulomonas cellasea DSM 20118 TaxID=1408250 RepID=A0A0A0BCB2_9CELL|nr:peptidoglycan-binding protein [Cellulomonas cellasea]KGM03757.1 hydrolase [Cellulomonas cellasea DSM 20118]